MIIPTLDLIITNALVADRYKDYKQALIWLKYYVSVYGICLEYNINMIKNKYHWYWFSFGINLIIAGKII